MTFRDVQPGQIFQFWDNSQLCVALKLQGQGAVLLPDGYLCNLHANKKCSEPESVPATCQLGFGSQGEMYLYTPLQGDKIMARRVIMIGQEIMHKKRLKKIAPQQTGGDGDKLRQVDIILSLIDKKLHELETLARTVKLLLEENVSTPGLDNTIMLPSGEKNPGIA